MTTFPRTWVAGCLLGLVGSASVLGHDIPDARVDRSIQVVLGAERLRVEYEVSLSELTLAQDLRQLVGPLPSGLDRRELYDRYGREVAPLNARGFVITVDGVEVELAAVGFDLFIEEHPRYLFRFEAAVPSGGRLVLRDTNYVSSEGTSRLALRAEGVEVWGYEGPSEVADVPIRPLWQLSPSEARRTKEIALEFAPEPAAASAGAAVVAPVSVATPPPAATTLTRLLDRTSGGSLPALFLAALVLGAVHAFQPGHGKTLVAAASVGAHAGRGVLLAAVTTLTHVLGVLALAGVLWLTRTVRYAEINTALTTVAGFVIAAIGCWRLGRGLGGHDVVTHRHEPVSGGSRSLFGLGLAGGLVPCWDAVILVVVAEALGQLLLGVALLAAFSLGMGLVLIAVGMTAARLRAAVAPRGGPRLERALGAVSGAVLAGIGLLLMGPG